MKTMKKLLSLCLALCLVLGLATPAFAAMTGTGTIADPFVCESVEDFPAHVMVNGFDTAFFQVPAGGMTLTINHAYAQIVNPRGLPLADCAVNGSSASYTFAETAPGDVVVFGIYNPNPRMGIDVAMTLSNDAPEVPVGTMENPAELLIDINEANIEANTWGYYYTWTAESYGELVIAMDCESWEYQVSNVTSSWQSDSHASNDEEAVWAETLYVCPGDEIQVCVNTQPGEGWGEYPAGTVAFSASFADQEEKFEYITTTKQLMLGENYVVTERAADVTICEFCPEEAGVYTITATLPSWVSDEADLQVGYWGGNPFFVYPPEGEVTDTVACTITNAGQTAMIGVSGAAMVVLTIEKTGEYVAPVTTVVEYDNGETPVDYTLGDYDVLVPVDEAQANAVLGDDGYYHLNDAEGPVLVVDLVSGGINMADAATLGQLSITVKNDDGYNYTKTDFTNAFNAYAECAATENQAVSGVKVYPATEGLVAMIEELAQAKGWYEFAGIEGWLGMCKAVQVPAAVYGGEFPVEVKLAAGETAYYEAYRIGGSNLVIKNGDAVVTMDGEKYNAVNGVVTVEVESTSPFVPVYFGVTNNGDSAATFTLELAYPVGTMNNPAVMVLGENTASLEAGDEDGYLFVWTATEDGNLKVSVSSTTGWSYSVNNLTTGIYGDRQTSEDASANTQTVKVSKGDEIQVSVNTYDAANPWTSPAGDVTVTIEMVEPVIFEDVPADAYYKAPVEWAVQNGITSGQSTTKFAPYALAQRCQVVTFLWRAEGCPEPETTENPFTDVKEDDYFYKAVLWAVEKGITSGQSATKFGPFAVAQRCQVVTFLWRAADCPKPDNKTNPFTDVNEDDYFYNAVLWAVENKITTGTSGTTFSPFKECERCQVVTFLHRAQ